MTAEEEAMRQIRGNFATRKEVGMEDTTVQRILSCVAGDESGQRCCCYCCYSGVAMNYGIWARKACNVCASFSLFQTARAVVQFTFMLFVVVVVYVVVDSLM